jgi:nitrate/nitrite-specific signal transduction histidine kinase
MILLTLLAGGVGLWQVLNIGQAVSDAREKEQQQAWSLELLAAGHRLVAALDHMLLTQDSALMSTDVPVSLGTLIFYMDTMQASGGDPETADTLKEIQVTYDELRRAVSEVDVLARQERWTEVETALDQEIRPANSYMNLLLRRLVHQTGYDVQAATLRAQMVVQRAALLLAVLVALTTTIALGWRQFVFQGMGRSITELRQGVERISSGDLEYTLDVRTGDEIEELGDEFNKMADELAGLIGGLEQQVTERTADLERRTVQLEAAAEVAREATAIRDVAQLLDETVHLISERFGFYHAGVFLVDDAREYAALRAASSEGGRRMLERGHKLAVGKVGMVGYVTGTGEARITLDVGEDAAHFVNPDLPETRSEITLPLRVRGEVIGALDVQSTEEAAQSSLRRVQRHRLGSIVAAGAPAGLRLRPH